MRRQKPAISPRWKATCDYLLGECTDLHVLLSYEMGFAHLTDRRGVRHRLDHTMDEWEVSVKVETVRKINNNYYVKPNHR